MAVSATNTLTLLALLGTTSATALAGQECPDGEVSSILINAHPFFDTDPSTDGGAVPWFYNLANGLHADTNEDFLRGELLFGVGECYDPFLVDESERLIRRLAFIDRVEVASEPSPTDPCRSSSKRGTVGRYNSMCVSDSRKDSILPG